MSTQKDRRSRRLGTQSEGTRILGGKLEGRLATYAAAAGAVAGVLGLAQPLSAVIVYTPANQVISQEGTFIIDLNHDGTVDFLIGAASTGIGFVNNLFGSGRHFGDAVEVKAPDRNRFAQALKSGAVIGPSAAFNPFAILASSSPSFRSGPWVNVKNRFLGLTFDVSGKVYYGWAEISVGLYKGFIQAKLEGYAYNNVANQPIVAGQKSDSTGAATLEPASLGLLSLGSPGLPLWRRKEFL